MQLCESLDFACSEERIWGELHTAPRLEAAADVTLTQTAAGSLIVYTQFLAAEKHVRRARQRNARISQLEPMQHRLRYLLEPRRAETAGTKGECLLDPGLSSLGSTLWDLGRDGCEVRYASQTMKTLIGCSLRFHGNLSNINVPMRNSDDKWWSCIRNLSRPPQTVL